MKFKTDLVLKILAMASLLMIPISIWSIWQFIEMALYGKAFPVLLTILVHGIGIEVLVSLITAWAFLRKLRWFLFLYIPYSIYMLPNLMAEISNYLYHPQLHSPFYFPSICYAWIQTGFLLAICCTCLLCLFETYHSKKNLTY